MEDALASDNNHPDDIARAVLMAVREPDDEFALAATDGHDTYWNYAGDGEPSGPSETFTAIVDAILNEKDTTND